MRLYKKTLADKTETPTQTKLQLPEKFCEIIRIPYLLKAIFAERKIHCDLLPVQMYQVSVKKLKKPEDGRFYKFSFCYVNNTQVETVGIFSSPKEMKGKTDFDCFAQPSANKTYADFVTIVETKHEINTEEVLFDKLGHKHVFRVYKYPFILFGKVVFIFGISIDITREKELEEEEKKLVKTIEAERTRYKNSFFLSSKAEVQVDVETDRIINANKMYHIANDYCVEISNIELTDTEIQTINASFGLHYFKKEKKLCLTALLETSTPEYSILLAKNNSEITAGLTLAKTEPYRLIGKPVDILNASPYDKTKKAEYLLAVETENPKETENLHLTRTGKLRLMRVQARIDYYEGRKIYAGVDTDITEETALREELEKMALSDALTKIGTRRLLEINSISALEGAKRHNTPPQYVGFIFIDLDRLKYINDTYGHAAGDEALKHIAKEITQVTRATDTCVRLGGDEFAILCTGITAPKEITLIENRFRKAIEKTSCQINDNITLTLSGSVGSSLYSYSGPEETDTRDSKTIFDELLKEADSKMYAEKLAKKHK